MVGCLSIDLRKNNFFYLDANVFIFASINKDLIGENARRLLSLLERDLVFGITSSITVDEVVWNCQKFSGREDALEAGFSLFYLKNLKIVDYSSAIAFDFLKRMKEYSLSPRDAIHYSTMLSLNIPTIISEDKDFDKAAGIKRIGIEKAIKELD